MSETVRQIAERVVDKLLNGPVDEHYDSPEDFNKRPGGRNDPLRQTTVPVQFPKGAFSGNRPAAAPGDDEDEDEEKAARPRFQWKPRQEAKGSSSETPGKAFNQGSIPSKTSGSGRSGTNASKSWHQGKASSKMSPSGGTSKNSAGKAFNQGKIPSKTSSQGAKSAVGGAGNAWHTGKIPHKTSSQGATSAVGTPGKAWKTGKSEKGEMVASKPGAISYKEALMRRVLENIRVKKAMKQGKSMPGRMVASKPGKVGYRSEAATGPAGGGMKGLSKKKLKPVASAPGKVNFGKK